MGVHENMALAVRRAMRERGKSLLELSEEIGVSKTTLQNCLRGKFNPRLDTVEVLIEKLELPPSELFDGPPEGLVGAESVLRAAEALSGLPQDRQEEGVRLLVALIELFRDS